MAEKSKNFLESLSPEHRKEVKKLLYRMNDCYNDYNINSDVYSLLRAILILESEVQRLNEDDDR